MFDMGVIINIITVLVTFVGIIVVARQTYEHFIRQKAFDYIERFNSADFMEIRISVERWLLVTREHDDLAELLFSQDPSDVEGSIKMKTYLNFFQELGVAFEKRMIDKRIFFKNFDFLILSNWYKFEKFIFSLRERQNDFSLYKRFELMAREVERMKNHDQGKLYIFGYGSLMSEQSILKTLPRTSVNTYDALLKGFRRKWNIIIPVYSDVLDKRINAVFLNIDEEIDAITEGVLFEISKDELSLFKNREMNYRCIEVTPSIQTEGLILHREDTVVTFIAHKEHRLVTNEQDDLFIMQLYLDVLESLKASSSHRYEAIRRNTESHSLPTLEGHYRFK